MKVAYVSSFFPESISMADEMLAAWPLLRCLPPALAAAGNDVVVLAHAAQAADRIVNDVRYRFIDPGRSARRVSHWLNRWKPRHGAAYYLPANRLVRNLRLARPDIVHFAGLTLDLQLAMVARACRQMRVPLVVHFHGGVPDRGKLRFVQRYNAARVNRVLVTTTEQAEIWISAGLFDASQFMQVVETSSPFSGVGREAVRTRTAMIGEPVYLSAGRLHEIKDPLTMLRGFERIASSQPDARLYLYFLTGELLPKVERFLSERPALANRIELRGRAASDEMEAIYSSADFLLQASLREWSGLAVIEAMSCGCIPIVSDIPSFRMLTAGGRLGRLFPVGNADRLADAALSIDADERKSLACAVRDHFERELSFEAMARQIDVLYRSLCPDLPQRPNAGHGPSSTGQDEYNNRYDI